MSGIQAKMVSIAPFRAARESVSKLIQITVEKELDLRVLFAIGDSEGPLVGEIRIATSSRRNFEDVLRQAQAWRGEKITVHFSHIIRGDGPASRVRNGVEERLREQGMHKRKSWWCVSAIKQVTDIVDLVACLQDVPFLTEAEADALERKKQDEQMNRMLP